VGQGPGWKRARGAPVTIAGSREVRGLLQHVSIALWLLGAAEPPPKTQRLLRGSGSAIQYALNFLPCTLCSLWCSLQNFVQLYAVAISTMSVFAGLFPATGEWGVPPSDTCRPGLCMPLGCPLSVSGSALLCRCALCCTAPQNWNCAAAVAPATHRRGGVPLACCAVAFSAWGAARGSPTAVRWR